MPLTRRGILNKPVKSVLNFKIKPDRKLEHAKPDITVFEKFCLVGVACIEDQLVLKHMALLILSVLTFGDLTFFGATR